MTGPYGCAWCSVLRSHHGRRWHPTAGMHSWAEPSPQQIKDRMVAHRSRRAR
ncbi:hypothetical protein [Streptomyces sp. NPDC029554]|uniref:hypothetical protein n=1 Tax=Streptomyces sp. NPDC029554 TaxID=3155126 RepID=UPI0033EC27AD